MLLRRIVELKHEVKKNVVDSFPFTITCKVLSFLLFGNKAMKRSPVSLKCKHMNTRCAVVSSSASI